MLYIVPTPIGNLEDITIRALRVLKMVDLIAAEDTRHTSLLLHHFSIDTNVVSFHSYNEQKKTFQLIKKLKQGVDIALVSDAGTPLINDPGFHLVKCCHQIGIKVIPLPGSCAAITALSAAGLASDHFCYEGFLPVKYKNRRKVLQELMYECRTLIFYESPHRLLATLSDMINIWGSKRYVVLARELTKVWESIRGLPVGELFDWVKIDKNRYRGEIVLVVDGYKGLEKNEIPIFEIKKKIALLRQLLPLKKSINIIAEFYGLSKNKLYKYVLEKEII